jgi:hypothetical protein
MEIKSMIEFTPPRLGRRHLIFGAVLVAIGLTLMFDALSSTEAARILNGPMRNSWFFQNSYHDVEWMWGLAALAVATVWVGGSVGWWIVRSLLFRREFLNRSRR